MTHNVESSHLEGESNNPSPKAPLPTSVVGREDSLAISEALLISALRQHELREAAENSNQTLRMEIEERSIELKQSVGEIEAISYCLAHDLRAPVRAIHGFTEMALDALADPMSQPAAALLKRVVNSANRMDSLIQDLLNFSDLAVKPICLSEVDVEKLVRSIIDEHKELSLPHALVEIDSPLLSVRAHRALLGQCLENLLDNAVKFVEPGALPHVRVRTEVSPRLATGQRSPFIRIWVEDDGIGIAPDGSRRIFEIFQRLHAKNAYEGSGIGLAIARKAVEKMQGRLGVEPGVEKGSRFWIELAAA